MNRPRELLDLMVRAVSPFAQPWRAVRAARSVPWFFSSLSRYGKLTDEHIAVKDLYPCLTDRRQPAGLFDVHYFYQDIWAARRVLQSGCHEHVDVGSRVDGFVGHCACFTRVKYVDLRPLKTDLANIVPVQGTILDLPFDTHSVPSLSCLHVAEHIGLGRYGDPIDPEGSKKAIQELSRVLAVDGNLYFAVPIGRERVCFNAHRIFDPLSIISGFSQLNLVSFSAIDDHGSFHEDTVPERFRSAEYGCGLFHFRGRIE